MWRIYFIEPNSDTKISYNRVHRKNEFRWKDPSFPLKIAYEGKKEDFETSDEQELYEMYLDFLDLLIFYQNNEQ